ncbi:MAG: single-stranded DNA-binding protein [Candidatus Helarchaeota archaeon]
MSQNEENKEIEDLRPGLRSINLKVKCGPINDVREIVSRKTGENLRVTEALVGDATGCVLLTLWNDDIDKIEPDHVYQMTNVYTTIFKGSLRLNIGKYGSFEEVEGDGIEEINEANNLSDKVYEQPQRDRFRYGGGPGYGNKPNYGQRPKQGGWKSSFSNRPHRRRY